MGGIIMILTRGIGKRLTYRIPTCYRVVLVERLGGLFFDGGCSCAGDSFAGHSGLYHCESLVVSILRDNILRVRGLETAPDTTKMHKTIIVMPCFAGKSRQPNSTKTFCYVQTKLQ